MPRGINFPTLPCLSPEETLGILSCMMASKHAHKAVSQDSLAMWLDNAYTCIRKRDDR